MLLQRPCSSLLVLFLLVGACSGTASLSEAPPTDTPTVDGSISEWGPRLTPLDNAPVAMTALSTDSLLYVAIRVRDRALVRTIARQGLVVWADPTGGTNRAYGVQYPLGLRRQQAGRSQSASATIDAVSLRELEVLRGDTLRTRIPAQFSSGVRGKVTLNSGALICELALPVGPQATSEHSLTTPLGRTIGLGLQTPTAESEDDERPEAPDPDIAASSGGRPERPSPRPQQRERQVPEPPQRPEQPTLDEWVTIPTGSP